MELYRLCPIRVKIEILIKKQNEMIVNAAYFSIILYIFI